MGSFVYTSEGATVFYGNPAIKVPLGASFRERGNRVQDGFRVAVASSPGMTAFLLGGLISITVATG